MQIKTGDLNYVILPGRFCAEQHLTLFERSYAFWANNWNAVFKELKTDVTVSPDNFFKQDLIPVITHGDTIVAIHLYSLYDLRADCNLDHSYLHHNFNSGYFSALRKRGFQAVMSMESLFVNSEYRRSATGLSFMEILISLGQKVFSELTRAQAIIAPARSDVKVAQTAYGLGFEPVERNVILNNVPVDLITCTRDKIIPVPVEGPRLIVESLWRRRINAITETAKPAAA